MYVNLLNLPTGHYFLDETKVNSTRLIILFKTLAFISPLFWEIPHIGFAGGIWILWGNSPKFSIHILDQDNKFICGCINDGSNKYNWLVSFVYGY